MTIWPRRKRDGLKLASSRRKETERLTRPVECGERKRIALALAMDEVVFGMALRILIDQNLRSQDVFDVPHIERKGRLGMQKCLMNISSGQIQYS